MEWQRCMSYSTTCFVNDFEEQVLFLKKKKKKKEEEKEEENVRETGCPVSLDLVVATLLPTYEHV